MSVRDFLKCLMSGLYISLSQVVVVDEIQVEIHFEDRLLDFVPVHAGRSDDILGHVNRSDRQIFFVDPPFFLALSEQFAPAQGSCVVEERPIKPPIENRISRFSPLVSSLARQSDDKKCASEYAGFLQELNR